MAVCMEQSFDSNPRPTVFQLPRQTGALAVAQACRESALHFVNEVASDENSHRSFLVWLSGSYSWLTSYAREASTGRPSDDRFNVQAAYGGVESEMLRERITDAREEVLSVLRSLTDEECAYQFAGAAIVDGLIIECHDGEGNRGWIPVAQKNSTIVQRILSLVAVDYLMQGEEYEGSLCVCGRCDRVSFDSIDRARGSCRHHNSGIYARRIADTWPAAPRETA